MNITSSDIPNLEQHNLYLNQSALLLEQNENINMSKLIDQSVQGILSKSNNAKFNNMDTRDSSIENREMDKF